MKSDPRYNSYNAKEVVKVKIQGLLQRGAFEFVDKRNVPSDANLIGGRFIFAIKQPRTSIEQYQVLFIVHATRTRTKTSFSILRELPDTETFGS